MNIELLRNNLSKSPVKNEEISGVSLCILTEVEGEDFLFIIHRSKKVPSHRDQLAFIGGHLKKGELPQECILREFEEETSLEKGNLQLLGTLPPVYSRGRQMILTYVGTVSYSKLQNSKSNGEWDYAVFFPLKTLENKEGWTYFNSHQKDQVIKVLMNNLNFENIQSVGDGQKPKSFILWGATAKMIWHLITLLPKGEL